MSHPIHRVTRFSIVGPYTLTVAFSDDTEQRMRLTVLAFVGKGRVRPSQFKRSDLKGAKRSCDTQVCGACTVLVDGMAVSACTYLALEADGGAVLTVEGLAEGDSLHPLQRAFLDAGAVQCGFCTSGMLLTARAMLAETPAPSREDVLHYLRGSLCRCTGYRKIVEAIMAAAETAR